MEFPLVRDVSVHNVGPSGSLDSRLTQLTPNSWTIKFMSYRHLRLKKQSSKTFQQ